MIICMDTDWTCATGETPNEAYATYLEDNEDSVNDAPENLRWFRAEEVKLKMITEPLPKAKPAAAKK